MRFPFGVLPLVSLQNEKEAETTLSLLSEGGLSTVEIACRTPYCFEAIGFAVKKFPRLQVGAGTVLNDAQARCALDMGASFLVSPGLSEKIARLARGENIPYYPGCATATDILRALDLGVSAVKFFPAEAVGGIKALRALAEPFRTVTFLPTGGITMETFGDYLALPYVDAVGGSFPLRGNIAENCAKIRALGRKA